MQLSALSFSAHAQYIRFWKIFAKKVLRSFDTEIMKKLRKFQYWGKILSFKKTCNERF